MKRAAHPYQVGDVEVAVTLVEADHLRLVQGLGRLRDQLVAMHHQLGV